ncbi:hypothetical protein [Cellulomonas sp. WB94]|uniref:hypothetical protein n=1 Tax=Cellulomonas sp. WB94 TaxID=2173174 RepID=UPI0018D577CF|nr:hypothetical protein [Cellulomonas sp. WB94]
MDVVLRIVVGLLLLAHGLVHLLYFVTSADDPKFPFTITSSWLVPEPARRPVATVLVAVTIVAFALLGLAVWGCRGWRRSGRGSRSSGRWPRSRC